ncbi:hypothetical protein PIB30_034981 [Stylosanthes scabra]|uniref:Uncharacterized protein n=1 Tax=Stylosanthes scabra TaxID=79078 RepID=A0ABU6QCK2_9FABA|nr:hypothetical protein [Stylosanthes scabra]
MWTRVSLCGLNRDLVGWQMMETISGYKMGSGVIYYEYEKRGKFEDFDMKADAELGTFKIRRYHLDD